MIPFDGRVMLELIFVVEEVATGYVARAVGASIFTEAEDVSDLHARVREAVRCHFGSRRGPDFIRLHFVRDEVIAAVAEPGLDEAAPSDVDARWSLRPPASANDADVEGRRPPTTTRRAGSGVRRDRRR